MKFRGQYTNTVDEKGRVAIPSKFREVLNGSKSQAIMVTKELDGNLVAFSMEEWEKFEEEIRAFPDYELKLLMAKRFYLGGSHECNLDVQGRILIPQSLREHGKLQREALFLGLGHKFEIWSPEIYLSHQATIVEDPEGLREAMKEIQLRRQNHGRHAAPG